MTDILLTFQDHNGEPNYPSALVAAKAAAWALDRAEYRIGQALAGLAAALEAHELAQFRTEAYPRPDDTAVLNVPILRVPPYIDRPRAVPPQSVCAWCGYELDDPAHDEAHEDPDIVAPYTPGAAGLADRPTERLHLVPTHRPEHDAGSGSGYGICLGCQEQWPCRAS